jgi:HAD superfamily hydrolase (TIGR01509 family)
VKSYETTPVGAVLFDMDGVLIHSEPVHMEAARLVLERYGIGLTPQQYIEFFLGKIMETGFSRYLAAIGSDVDVRRATLEQAAAYLELAAGQLTPLPGVIEFIRDLEENRVALALVTGSLRSEAWLALEALDLTGVFEVVMGAEDVTKSKPDPEGYLKAARTLGVSLEECVVIEDAPSNLVTLTDIGISTVGVTTTHSKAELTAAGAGLVIDVLRPGCLEGLRSRGQALLV